MKCPGCGKKDRAVWRYGMRDHIKRHHPEISLAKYAHLWELTKSEKAGMKIIWNKRKDQKQARKYKSTLTLSAAHSSRSALGSVSFFLSPGLMLANASQGRDSG
jgi:hypothetical protein